MQVSFAKVILFRNCILHMPVGKNRNRCGIYLASCNNMKTLKYLEFTNDIFN